MLPHRLVPLAFVLPVACSNPSPQGADSALAAADRYAWSGSEQEPVAVTTTAALAADAETKARAVLQGLRWLVRHQNPDGSWGGSFGARCAPEGTCAQAGAVAQDHHDVGLTGLVLLSWLHVGLTPESGQDIVDTTRGRRHRIGSVVGSGIDWLRERQEPNGSFSPRAFLYNEAIATLALCEAARKTNDVALDDAAQRAIDFIQAAQRPSPDGAGLWGWRYAPRAEVEASGTFSARELVDSDTSVTAWCAMALASARRAGLNVRQESIDGALAFARSVSAQNGMAGYLDVKGAGAKVTGKSDHFVYHPAAMSALTMLTRILTTGDFSDPYLGEAAKQILLDPPAISEDRLSVDYYYWHAATLALAMYDGPSSPRATAALWDVWNPPLSDVVLGLQDGTKGACTNGGWLVPDRWGADGHGGALYATALCVMTLMEPAPR